MGVTSIRLQPEVESSLEVMAGKLHRRGAKTRCFHTIEVLAGCADGPAIGEEG